jgi:hypothetical protein
MLQNGHKIVVTLEGAKNGLIVENIFNLVNPQKIARNQSSSTFQT